MMLACLAETTRRILTWYKSQSELVWTLYNPMWPELSNLESVGLDYVSTATLKILQKVNKV